MVGRDRRDARVGVHSKVGVRRRLGASAAAVALFGGLGTASLALAAPAGAFVLVNVPCNGGDPTALIAAINSANNGGGFINLAPGCTYVLTTPIDSPDGPNGLPAITSQITINGNGSTIQGTGTAAQPFRILAVRASGNLTLSTVTITGGLTENIGGGAIVNHGHLTLNSSRITGNDVFGAGGGGIANGNVGSGPTAVLSLVNSRVDHNNTHDPTFGAGGGIANTGSATLTSTEVDHNHAAATQDGNNGRDGGGGIFNSTVVALGVLTLSSSRVHDNTTAGNGGGIDNQGIVNLRSTFVNINSAVEGGGIFNNNAFGGGTASLSSSAVENNTASDTGGGILNDGGTVSLASSPVVGNGPNNCTGSAPSVPGCIG